MKKLRIIFATFLFVSVFAFTAAPAMAVDPLSTACSGAPNSPICDGGNDNPIVGPEGLLTKATRLLATVTAITAVIVIIIAGMTMTLSGGNSGQVQQSRDAIIYAAIALAIAALAEAIVRFVLSSL